MSVTRSEDRREATKVTLTHGFRSGVLRGVKLRGDILREMILMYYRD